MIHYPVRMGQDQRGERQCLGRKTLPAPPPQTRALTGVPLGGPPGLGPARAGSAAGTTTLSRVDRPRS